MTPEERSQEIRDLQKRLFRILEENDLEKNIEAFREVTGRMSELYGFDILEAITKGANVCLETLKTI